MGINTLLFVITEDHSLYFVLLISGGSFSFLNVVLQSELLNAVTIDLKLFMAEFIMGFVTRDNRVEVKDTFIWGLKISKNIVEVSWLV